MRSGTLFLIIMTREEFEFIYQSGPDTCFDLFHGMETAMQALTKRVKELEDRLAKDSHNSSKPPTSDGMRKKPKSLRHKSGKLSGGQQGHSGRTLCFSQNPDEIVLHSPSDCRHCGTSLDSILARPLSRRQIYEIPPQRVFVTEHRTFCKICSVCQTTNAGCFPPQVSQSIQYGPRLKAICVYLQQYQLLPFGRTQELLSDLYGCSVSEGTLSNGLISCYNRLERVESAIFSAIKKAPVGNFDETGIRIQKSLHWLHVSSTSSLTFLATHRKRGKEAIEAIGILPAFGGTAVHDAFASYLSYGCSHSLCNAHLLRELLFFKEQKHHIWAGKFIDLLLCIKKAVESAKASGENALESCVFPAFEVPYQNLVEEGLSLHPARACSGKRGRTKQSEEHNLLERLSKYRHSVLAFLYDFRVPFDNNQAERDIRMVKLRQKISGCFRSEEYAKIFCRIRGYISTLRKQGMSILPALQRVFEGNPIMPDLG